MAPGVFMAPGVLPGTVLHRMSERLEPATQIQRRIHAMLEKHHLRCTGRPLQFKVST